jgi:uncharacterized protein YjbI with pentapeptide repeats
MGSVSVTKDTGGAMSTAQFTVPVDLDIETPPVVGDAVLIENATGDDIFGGQIVRTEPTPKAGGASSIVEYICSCQDWTALLDGTIVISESYLAQNDSAVIADLFTTYLPSVSTALVTTVTSLASITFTDVTLRAAMDQIAKLTGAIWYVDPIKQLRYYAPGTVSASFSLSDTPDNVTSFGYNPLPKFTTEFSAPANKVTVLGKIGTGGVVVTYTKEDASSQALYGVRARTIVDRSIQTAGEAQLRAEYEVAQYAYPRLTGSLSFKHDGLDVGQTVAVVCASAGINASYVVTRLSMNLVTDDLIKYTASLGQYQPDLWEIMRRFNNKTAWPSANLIEPGSIVGTQLNDGTVTGSKIANATITAQQIANATITGTLIANATITGQQINNATITAAQIANGSITAQQIANATISFGNMISGNLDNLIEDPSFERYTGGVPTWTPLGLASVWTIGPDANARSGSNCVKLVGDGGDRYLYPSQIVRSGDVATLEVTPGEEYYSELWSKSADGSGTCQLWVAYYNSAYSYIGGLASNISATGSYGVTVVSSVAPATSRFMRVYIHSADATGTWYFDDVHLRRKIMGGFISNATITADNIANATITAQNIANATITSTQISGTAGITGNQIANATVTANNIANATITAQNIANASITGALIASATINGTNIAGDAGIVGGQLANATITTTQISGSAGITGGQIANATISAQNISNATITGSLIANEAIEAKHIANLTITATQIANATLTSEKIANATIIATNISASANIAGSQLKADAGITGGQIANTTITGSNLVNQTITATQIALAAITGQLIANSTIAGGNIANQTITAQNIANAAITGALIANNTITGSLLVNNTVSATQIANATITGALVANNTLTGSLLVNNTITAQQIANATITATQIANATITGTQIAAATIAGSNIVNATVTAQQIANYTVTAQQIANATITASQLENATVTATQIANLTITAAQIANLTINGAQIANEAITSQKIANLTITDAQIANATITGAKIANATITSALIDTLAVGKITGWAGASIAVGAGMTFSTTGNADVQIQPGCVTTKDATSAYLSYLRTDASNHAEVSLQEWSGGMPGAWASLGTVYGLRVSTSGPATASITLAGVADFASLKIGGNEIVNSSRIGDLVSLKIGGTEVIDSSRNVNAATYKVAGTKVLGGQGSAIADPSVAPPAGTSTGFSGDDYNCISEVYNKLKSVLGALRTHGIIAT